MKLVQVIAGLEERVFMNRPVIQEMLDQFKACPLLGLDYIFEVLQNSDTPVYHCALCTKNHNERDIMSHIISTTHVFNFIKEFFPLAWARFSSIQDVEQWTELDLECYHAVINKIDSVYGQRCPSIVESEEKLEDAVDQIPVNQYSSNRSELDTFIKNLKHSEQPSISGDQKPRIASRTVSRVLVTEVACSIPPSGIERVTCQIRNISNIRALESGFVLITRNPSNFNCDIKPGFSRVFVKNQIPRVDVYISNPKLETHLNLLPGVEVAIAKWKK